MIKLSLLVISAVIALCLAVLFIAMKIANIKSEKQKETTLLAAFTSLLLMVLGCSFIVDGLIDLYFYMAK